MIPKPETWTCGSRTPNLGTGTGALPGRSRVPVSSRLRTAVLVRLSAFEPSLQTTTPSLHLPYSSPPPLLTSCPSSAHPNFVLTPIIITVMLTALINISATIFTHLHKFWSINEDLDTSTSQNCTLDSGNSISNQLAQHMAQSTCEWHMSFPRMCTHYWCQAGWCSKR